VKQVSLQPQAVGLWHSGSLFSEHDCGNRYRIMDRCHTLFDLGQDHRFSWVAKIGLIALMVTIVYKTES
jgi:hypothetical protein